MTECIHATIQTIWSRCFRFLFILHTAHSHRNPNTQIPQFILARVNKTEIIFFRIFFSCARRFSCEIFPSTASPPLVDPCSSSSNQCVSFATESNLHICTSVHTHSRQLAEHKLLFIDCVVVLVRSINRLIDILSPSARV